jgi:dihydrofolate reductase
MRITVHTFLTLDGVMQGPGGPEEDTEGGFGAGGWMVPFVDQGFGEIVEDWFAKTDAVLLGRTTYGLMQPYWSAVTDPDNVVAQVLNDGRKYVVSATMHHADWGDTTILRSLDEVRDLKASDGGELQVHGSAGLASALHEAGLIDEYRLVIFPVTVGAGKRLFASEAPPSSYELITSRTTGGGAMYVELSPTAFHGGSVFTVEDGKEAVSEVRST